MDFNSLRNAAGSAITSGVDKVTAAARGLRMPGMSAPQPAPAGAPLPQIDPSLVDRAQATMRAPVAPQPPIPVLNDVVKPGIAGPFQPQAPIPTLTDVHTAGTVNPPPFQPGTTGANPNVPSGAMSAERAAFNAEQAASAGPMAPAQPGVVARGLRAAGGVLGVGSDAVDRALAPVGRVLAPVARVAGKVAAPAAIGMGLYDTYQGGKAGDTGRAVTGIGDAVAGVGLLNPVTAPVAGAYLGGRAVGGIANHFLPEDAKDAIGGTINQGLRAADDILGTHWSTDDSAYLQQKAQAAQAATTAKAATSKAAPAASAVAAPTDPTDVTAFNDRMKQIGADSISMRAGTDGTRTIGNDKPADKAMQDYTAQHMLDRTAQFTAADQANREQGMRQLAYGQVLQNPDVVRMTDELNTAMRSGSPVAIQAASNARDNLIRTLSADHQAQTQANLTARGQDLQAGSARATNMLGMYNAQREQGNTNREFNRNATNDNFTQGEAAEKHLDDALTARFTTGADKDGKPQVNVTAKNAALVGIQRSAAALGAESVKDLSKPDRERLIAGADLAAKVNTDASNILPWKPDVIGEVMPHDLIGLRKNSSGDYVIPRGAAAGRVIPARYLDKVGADRFGGQPTDIYDNLKAK